MLLSKGPFTLCVFLFLVSLLVVQTRQNSRQKRQILTDLPRIITQNGDLIFEGGSNHNITFRSWNRAGIFLDDHNVKALATQVTTNKAAIKFMKETSEDASKDLNVAIRAVESKADDNRDGVSSMTTRMNQLTSQFTSFQDTVNTARDENKESLDALKQQLINKNECNSNPCKNGGKCVDLYSGYLCQCPDNWQGPRCDQDVNECSAHAGTDLGCQNGATCINSQGGYSCQCAPNYYGIHCRYSHEDCAGASHTELCGHGTCVNEKRSTSEHPKYRCICEAGWNKTSTQNAPCTVDVNECESGQHCSSYPPVRCINVPGSFRCDVCPAGYTGNGVTCSDINECLVNNGGCSLHPRVQCINIRGSNTCGRCPTGYSGDGRVCRYQENQARCANNNGGCHPRATCTGTDSGRTCRCPESLEGSGVGINGCRQPSCGGVTCSNGANCIQTSSGRRCNCTQGWMGNNCRLPSTNCDSYTCYNGGTCVVGQHVGQWRPKCNCPAGFTGPRCNEELQSCGGSRVRDTGSIIFPASGTQYSHDVECAWTIRVSSDKKINLYFTRFDVEYEEDCEFDFLQINDGASPSSNLIGKYCDDSLPNGGQIASTGNTVYLLFKSDENIAHDGFQLSWNSSKQTCGQNMVGDTGTFSSPGYPNNYALGTDCVWTVSVTPGNVILFTFSNGLAIETHSNCNYDWLEIRDGFNDQTPVLIKYCTSSSPSPLRTKGPFAYLRFHTDNRNSARGFNLTYSTPTDSDGRPTGCGKAFNNDTGVIQTSAYPSSQNANRYCVWNITTSPDTKIRLTFSAFNAGRQEDCVRIMNSEKQDVASLCGSTMPSPVKVSGNQAIIIYRTVESMTGTGFSVSWSLDCDRFFRDERGSFLFSDNPSTVCRYIMDVPGDNIIVLSFVSFDVGAIQDKTCTGDYIEVFDGETESSRQIGQRFCSGNILKSIFRSTGSTMMVKLTLDSDNQLHGLNRAQYYSEKQGNPECGEAQRTKRHGTINSPGYPNNIPSTLNCTWHINVDAGLIINLQFHSLRMSGRTSSGCTEFVEVYDGNSVSSTSLGRYCDNEIPGWLTTSDNSMTIRLSTGNSEGKRGFYAGYTSTNVTNNCGRKLTEATGRIQSPNHPDDYPHGRDCVWVIRCQSARMQISITFTNFTLEETPDCAHDYLEIRDGSTASAPVRYKLCGSTTNIPHRPITSTANAFYLHFHSDATVTAPGFSLDYDGTSTGCGAGLTAPTGTIISPNYPRPYPRNSVCTWTITVSAGSVITMHFKDFAIESMTSECGFDRLQIRDKNVGGVILTNTTYLCGNRKPADITSISNKAWLRMSSDEVTNGRGFKLNYTQNCSTRLTALYGVIESPNFPRPYPHQMNCSWVIQAPLGHTIKVDLVVLNLEADGSRCTFDRLQISEDNSTQNYCGNRIPTSPFQSQSNRLAIDFRSDHSVSHGGFRLEYIVIGCSRIIRRNSDTLNSPKYPKTFKEDVECAWRVTADIGKSLQVTIVDLDLDHSTNCSNGAMEIYAGPDDTGPRIVQVCSSQTAQHVHSLTGHMMYVRYRAVGSFSGKKFKATFLATNGGCGGRFTAPQSRIHSPKHPYYPTKPMECEWLITVEPHTNVVINFTDLSLLGHSCRGGDILTIYNGASANDSQVGFRRCGLQLPKNPVFRSKGNQVFLRLKINSGSPAGSGRRGGFSLNYTTGCGGEITLEDSDNSQVVQSPGFPSYAPHDTVCEWTVKGPVGSVVLPPSLEFTFLHTASNPDCNTSYVEVSKGQAAGRRYCGTRAPSAIYGTDTITVKFVSGSVTSKFRALAYLYHKGCGTPLHTASGRFSSPKFPENYITSIECVWQIQIPPGNKLQISFSKFNLNSEGNFNGDYVEIRAPDVNGRLVGRWIDQNKPTNLTDLGGAWVKFRSDDGTPGPGFMAEWNTVYGGTLTGNGGQIGSPGYPYGYPSNCDYKWIIMAPEGKTVRLRFIALQMERRLLGHCQIGDSLKVYDPDEDVGELMGTYCDTDSPGTLYSDTNQVTLIFKTGSHVKRKGFLVEWTAITNSMRPGPTAEALGCGGRLNATDHLQTLTSPGNLASYNNSLNCKWSLNIPEGSSAEIKFTYMNLEYSWSCRHDYVTFNDDTTTRHRRYCGWRRPRRTIRLVGKRAVIKFITDSFYTRRGFRLTYKKVCGGRITGMTSYSVTSPNFPANYTNNLRCSWTITVTSGKTVFLNFMEAFNIADNGTCDNDYLQLKNGLSSSSPPLYRNTSNTNGRYCGNSRPVGLETSSNNLYASFVSNSSGVDKGFAFKIMARSMSCGYRIQLFDSGLNSESEITSPGYPRGNTKHMDCTWVIAVPAEERVQVDFEGTFDVPCRGDFIQFRDGGTAHAHQIGSPVCGHVPHSTVKSTGSFLYMRFVTNSLRSKGFKARVSIAACGGRITGVSGHFQSSNYPHNYPANQDCEWFITVPAGHNINVTVDDFRLQSSTNCSADYVEIRETNSTGDLLGRYCGGNLIGNGGVASAGSKIWAKFHSDGSIGGMFKLLVTASVEACGRDFTASADTIISPNYPNGYPRWRWCYWTIVVQEGRRVTLRIDEFDVRNDCSAVLVVKDGILPRSPNKRTICTRRATGSIIESNGNTMALEFKTGHHGTTGKGFKLSYTSDKAAYCGGELTNPSGTITFPGAVPLRQRGVVCVWRIHNPSPVNSTVVIKFNNMYLPYYCHNNQLVIKEGRDTHSPIVQKFCWRRRIPTGSISVPTSYVFLRFKSRYLNRWLRFNLTYNFKPCGGVLTEPGVITSPNYPGEYNHNDNCVWKISAPRGSRIKVNFTDFSFENHTNCAKDHLQIYNGGSPDSPRSRRFCGTDRPDEFTSQSNEIRIGMETDNSGNSTGFRLEFSFIGRGCGGLFNGRRRPPLMSPNYPKNYPHNTECRWDLRVPNSYMVKLIFNSPFDLQAGSNCLNDHVEVFDSFTNGTLVSMGKWCKNVKPPVMTSSTNRMVVVFRSDSTTNGNGFSASWKAVCGGVFKDDHGTIQSPGYPSNYYNNLWCNYTILPPSDRILLLTFKDFYLQPTYWWTSFHFHYRWGYYRNQGAARCQYDNITVYQGADTNGTRLGTFCGWTRPQRIQVFKSAHLTFRTDRWSTRRGFKIEYNAQECGGVYNRSAGEVRSGFDSLDYLHNLNCSWDITVDANMVVSFEFQKFEIERHTLCQKDYLAFYDGPGESSMLIERLCGTLHQVAPRIQSTGNRMFIRFITDSSVSKAGFAGDYFSAYGPKQGCGGTIKNSSGPLSSFDADNDGIYENRLTCEWIIESGINTVLTLNVTDLDIEDSDKCIYDSLSIYEDTHPNPMQTLCGTTPPSHTFRSYNNILRVVFHTDSQNTGRGFNATFASSPSVCRGSYNVTREKHAITSVDYPSPYPRGVRCSWILDTGDPQRTIIINMTDIQLAEGRHCPKQYVLIRDYPASNNGQESHYCGSKLPRPFESNGQMAQIIYHLDEGTTKRGFNLTYQVSDCNKTYTHQSGLITTQRRSGSYSSNMNCLINVTTASNTYVNLYFYRFNVEYISGCGNDYLEVKNGTSHVLNKLCGSSLPEPIFLPDNRAILRFMTNGNVTKYGYDITYVASTSGPGCGGVISGLSRGVFTSPDYPHASNKKQTCIWVIRPPARMQMFFRFEQTSLRRRRYDYKCGTNHVYVLKGESVLTQTTIGSYCRNSGLSYEWNTDNSIVVRYVNDVRAPVFRITFSTRPRINS